ERGDGRRDVQGRTHPDRLDDRQRQPANDPREAPLDVPVPPEPEALGMDPGDVLGPAEESGRSQVRVGPALVETGAVGDHRRRMRARGRPRLADAHGGASASPSANAPSPSIVMSRIPSDGADMPPSRTS